MRSGTGCSRANLVQANRQLALLPPNAPHIVQRLQAAGVSLQRILIQLQRRLRLPCRQVHVAAADQRGSIIGLHPQAEFGIAGSCLPIALQQVQRGQVDGRLRTGAAVGALKVLARKGEWRW